MADDLHGSGASEDARLAYAPRAAASYHWADRPVWRMLLLAAFAVATAFAFLAAYGAYVELQTRMAVPASMAFLYAPAAACVAFCVGLVDLLVRGGSGPLWRVALVIGCCAGVYGVLCPTLWR